MKFMFCCKMFHDSRTLQSDSFQDKDNRNSDRYPSTSRNPSEEAKRDEVILLCQKYCETLGIKTLKDLNVQSLRKYFVKKSRGLHPDILNKLCRANKLTNDEKYYRQNLYMVYTNAYDYLHKYLLTRKLSERKQIRMNERQNNKDRPNDSDQKTNDELRRLATKELSEHYKSLNNPDIKLLLLKDHEEASKLKDHTNLGLTNFNNVKGTSTPKEAVNGDHYHKSIGSDISEVPSQVTFCKDKTELLETLQGRKQLLINVNLDPLETYLVLGTSGSLKNKIGYWYQVCEPYKNICSYCKGFNRSSCKFCSNTELVKYDVKKEREFFEWQMTLEDLKNQYLVVEQKGDHIDSVNRGPLVIKLSFESKPQSEVEIVRCQEGLKVIKKIPYNVYRTCADYGRPITVCLPIINNCLSYDPENIKEFSHYDIITNQVLDEVNYERNRTYKSIPGFDIVLELRLIMNQTDQDQEQNRYRLVWDS